MARNDDVLAAEFERWNGIQRLIGAMGHSHLDVRVACAVFLAQLAKSTRWHDAIALGKGYRVLVEKLQSSEEREQLSALVTLRVLMQQVDSNVSDFSRAGGFAPLFRLIRGQIPSSTKVLGQALEVLRLSAANRTVAIEIKSAHFEEDVLKHLSHANETVQDKSLAAIEAMVEDEASREFIKKNGKVTSPSLPPSLSVSIDVHSFLPQALGTLTAFVDLSHSADHKDRARALTEQLK